MYRHILEELFLPDRYERLEQSLGSDVVRILVVPDRENLECLQLLAANVLSRDEGVMVPLFGDTGVGKTTFVQNANQWLPAEYGPTLNYGGDLSFDALTEATAYFAKSFPADNRKIIPINIDHRENNPPTDAELSNIKRFLRTNSGGVPSIVFWPQTNRRTADVLSQRYIEIAGEAAIKLPLVCKGPPQETWIDITKHTMALANKIENLEGLGVDPASYSIGQFRTLGAFLRKLSQDFNAQMLSLKNDLKKPLSIIIVFVSESNTPGVLSQLTSPSRYGLLDSHALISVTSQSVVGRWWAARRGLLTRAIVQLNAHAICLAPTAAASCIRNFSDSMPLFDSVGYNRYGPARGVRDLGRSDLGKLVSGEQISRFEARGTPAEDATAAFALLAESGFNLGKDKNLNRIMKDAIEALLTNKKQSFERLTKETKLEFCPLIPDNAIYTSDGVTCVEYTWRNGDFLSSKNRSTVAQYILTKLQNYSRELGWTSD